MTGILVWSGKYAWQEFRNEEDIKRSLTYVSKEKLEFMACEYAKYLKEEYNIWRLMNATGETKAYPLVITRRDLQDMTERDLHNVLEE